MKITIKQKIFARIKKLGRGAIFTPKDFLDIASRTAIDKTLSRFAQDELIRRITRGIYDYPKQHPTLGSLSPIPNQVAKVVAKNYDNKLQVSGAQAALMLGLSTQVPAKPVYYTDGMSRKIVLGNQILQFKHANARTMAGAGQKSGLVLQSIRYFGKDGLDNKTIRIMAQQLDHTDKNILIKLSRFAPDWSQSILKQLTT